MIEDDFDEDEDDELELPPHAIYRETGRGNALVARFDNKQEALMCLTAIGRILGCAVYLESEHSEFLQLPIPDRCWVGATGVNFRP